MKISLATNWREDLLEQVDGSMVDNFFGTFDQTLTGGGRPGYALTRVKKEFARKYIEKARSKGIKFNYLLNGSCMGNTEYEKKTHLELIDHLKWLDDVGIDYITMTIPYLIEIVKEQFPRIKVIASVVAHINTPRRARFYELMGADIICIDYMINRDFKAIKDIKEETNCEIEVLTNDLCLFQCPYRFYHYNFLSHASQANAKAKGGILDYSYLKCTLDRLNNPTEIIRSPWIRPEDTAEYESLGVKYFKIVDRTFPTARLLNSLKAYSSRRYDGNLLDLTSNAFFLPNPSMKFPDSHTKVMQLISQIPRASQAMDKLPTLDIKVDNRALDGFLEFFKQGKCTSLCHKCGYCESWAKKAITYDDESVDFYRKMLSKMAKEFTTSEFLKYSKYLSVAEKAMKVSESTFGKALAKVTKRK